MKYLIIATTFVVWLSSTAAAQTVSGSAVPAGCQTADMLPSKSKLEALLGRKDFSKDQFESTEQFSNRILKGMPGNIRISVPVRSDDGQYDADREVYSIDLMVIANRFERLEDYGLRPPQKRFGILVGGKVLEDTHYRGQTEFGVSRDVLKLKRRKLEIIFNGSDKAFPNQQSLNIPLSRTDAKHHIENLMIVIEGQPTAPYILEGQSTHAPDIYDAVDDQTDLRGLLIQPECGAVIDKTTAAVVASFNPSDLW